MKTQAQMIAETVAANEERHRRMFQPIEEPKPKPSGISCECGKELFWNHEVFSLSSSFGEGLECVCGKKGYWDWFRARFTWLKEKKKSSLVNLTVDS